MNTASSWSGTLRGILTQPKRGVVGLVDDLLALCREHRLELDWKTDRCRVYSRAGDWHELTDVVLRKSVFRAILARIAVLCNNSPASTTSPYGGQGEITVGRNPA